MSKALQIALPFDAPTSSSLPPMELGTSPTAIAIPPPDIAIAPTPIATIPAAIYFVRHRRARRYLLRVEPDGRLRVTIPRGGSKREAEAFAARNSDWVASQRERLSAPRIGAEERATLTARAAGELPQRLRELADVHGVTGLTRVSIRNQHTRWGSCGRDGHICLNWRLVLMPASVRDYVLIHELMHLRRMDHSAAYWKLVAAACPAYGEARAWLRANGRALR